MNFDNVIEQMHTPAPPRPNLNFYELRSREVDPEQSKRMAILSALCEGDLGFSDLGSLTGLTAEERTRFLVRLKSSKAVASNPDASYRITEYGRQVVAAGNLPRLQPKTQPA